MQVNTAERKWTQRQFNGAWTCPLRGRPWGALFAGTLASYHLLLGNEKLRMLLLIYYRKNRLCYNGPMTILWREWHQVLCVFFPLFRNSCSPTGHNITKCLFIQLLSRELPSSEVKSKKRPLYINCFFTQYLFTNRMKRHYFKGWHFLSLDQIWKMYK